MIKILIDYLKLKFNDLEVCIFFNNLIVKDFYYIIVVFMLISSNMEGFLEVFCGVVYV